IVSLIPRPLFLVFLFLLTLPPPPRSTLFPYTTLFRSGFRTCPAPRALRPRPGLLPGTLHVQDDGPAAHQHPLEVRAAGALEEPPAGPINPRAGSGRTHPGLLDRLKAQEHGSNNMLRKFA